LLSCNNAEIKESDTSKNDTMNTTTIEKQNPVEKNIKGPAGNIHVMDLGQGGLPVVFIHSFGGSVKHWENQMDHLKTKRRVIALDIRGHGASNPSSDHDYSVTSIANDIDVVADSLKLERFILVGHSMGGSSAISYAAKHPDRVAGLFITGTPGKTPEEQSKMIIASLESEKYDTVMEDYMKKLLADAKPETNQLEREGMNKISKQSSLSMIKALFQYDPLPDLRKYKGPVLIVSRPGDEQPNALHNAFPSIPHKVVEGTSHWIQLDKPGEFNRILDDFLIIVDKEPVNR
jgi:pimeloyl-ACP methyl ester carboxylesterase